MVPAAARSILCRIAGIKMSMHRGITLMAVGLVADMTMTTTTTVIGMTTMVTAMAMDTVQVMVVVGDVTR